MKRFVFFILILAIASTAFASFHAVKLTSSFNSWHHFEMKQLSVDVQTFGLFYETTIAFKLGFAPDYHGNLPPAGEYKITWDFNLVENAVITNCWLKAIGATDFIEADIVDLTTAEEQYEIAPQSQPRQLLRYRWYRNYSGTISKNYQMRFSPMTLTDAPVIKIRYLTPCLPYYNYRRIILPLNEFRVKVKNDITLRINDQDNPNEKPDFISNYSSTISWSKEGGWWKAILKSRSFFNQLLFGLAPETPDRIYLRTFANDETQFYQMAILPPITPEDRTPKNILLAVDLTDQTSNRKYIFEKYQKAVQLSASTHDSISLVYSSFTPVTYDSGFIPVTSQRINKMFECVISEPAPRLNTLPHLLRQAIHLFNLNKKSGEIWLVSDAYTHSDPAATAMEIISQTLGYAEQPVTFRIINASYETRPYIWLNGQRYAGNDYLYENLSRLSRGSYVKLREQAGYDFLDTILDCIAPTAATVEVDPQPVNGLSYSRFALNRGRVNFPITLPYYEIGLYSITSQIFVFCAKEFYYPEQLTLTTKRLRRRQRRSKEKD
ncbi:hypothetical protein H8E88_22985 [candidate division KSB1 bacterium]|nr:hypothetical protein [candidate division KSB1 bacterium]